MVGQVDIEDSHNAADRVVVGGMHRAASAEAADSCHGVADNCSHCVGDPEMHGQHV